jgi:hypothetical protein
VTPFPGEAAHEIELAGKAGNLILITEKANMLLGN